MKLVFGLFGAALAITFLAAFVLKIKDPAMIAVTAVGIVMMLIDLWQARNEEDT
jgi:lipid-A-disaccharide synthase-like uncharacterized protein